MSVSKVVTLENIARCLENIWWRCCVVHICKPFYVHQLKYLNILNCKFPSHNHSAA